MHKLRHCITIGVTILSLACWMSWIGHADPLQRGLLTNMEEDGYRGIWYYNQPQKDDYKFKYSGGFATYPQQHIPLAIYSPQSNKTFFCYGGRRKDSNKLLNMVSYYDHATGQVPRPTVVVARDTDDAHFNPTLSLDDKGYLYVFCNVHGEGKGITDALSQAYIYRSKKPYSIDDFTQVRSDNFSYSQVWNVPGQGVLWLHTRYVRGQRRLFWATSGDGLRWSNPQQLAHIKLGNYQISGAQGQRVATAFDHHPEKGGLNARTNIYYLETKDFGKTWQTVNGQTITLPLSEVQNPALVHDYQKEGLLVYLKDIQFNAAGHPVILYLTSKGFGSGPANGPRVWHTARWTGTTWEIRDGFETDHNYDHGSLYIEADGVWRIIAPTDPGPQPYGTGGEITVYISRDEGKTWTLTRNWSLGTGRNQTYVRRPVQAHPDFYAFWADGDAFKSSESNLYFASKGGAIYRLPTAITGEFARPEQVKP